MNSLLSLIPGNSFTPSGDLFDRFFEGWNVPSFTGKTDGLNPAFDVSENESEFIVTAELPGVDVKDVDITVSDGILNVKGEKRHETEEKGEDFHRVERRFGSFHRSFRIPGRVDSEKIDASYKDGILKVILPKAGGAEAKKIEIK